MAQKDPAVLIYFDKWISATNGMRSDFRAWYFDLLIYQYDKGFIPNDEDEIAGICRVRPSEYDNFKQMLEQVLKQKFKLNDDKYQNDHMASILKKREQFLDKRIKSGTIGAIIKMANTIKGYNLKHIQKLKEDLYNLEIEEINKHMDKQVLEQKLKLYINVDVNVDEYNYSFISVQFKNSFVRWLKYKKDRKESYKSKDSTETCYKKLLKFSNNKPEIAEEIINDAIGNNYAGFFEPKKTKDQQQKEQPAPVASRSYNIANEK